MYVSVSFCKNWYFFQCYMEDCFVIIMSKCHVWKGPFQKRFTLSVIHYLKVFLFVSFPMQEQWSHLFIDWHEHFRVAVRNWWDFGKFCWIRSLKVKANRRPKCASCCVWRHVPQPSSPNCCRRLCIYVLARRGDYCAVVGRAFLHALHSNSLCRLYVSTCSGQCSAIIKPGSWIHARRVCLCPCESLKFVTFSIHSFMWLNIHLYCI